MGAPGTEFLAAERLVLKFHARLGAMFGRYARVPSRFALPGPVPSLSVVSVWEIPFRVARLLI